MKTCIACGQSKPLGVYYRHSAMADGHLNKCKDCILAYQSARRHGPAREHILAHDRKRGLTDEHRARTREYCRTEVGRRRSTEAKRRWSHDNPEKRQAHTRVKRAIESGVLTRQPCALCGSADVHAHHDDYSNPLAVMWLCATHHAERHRALREQERAS